MEKKAENIIEGMGKCCACGTYGLLGNGLCQSCWDNLDDSYIVITPDSKACKPKVLKAELAKGTMEGGVCKFCGSSNLVKYGNNISHNKSGMRKAQRWLCRKCGHTFIMNGALPNMSYPKYMIQDVVRLRLEGHTLSTILGYLHSIYKRKVSTAGVLSCWLKQLGITPEVKDPHWRRSIEELTGHIELGFQDGCVYSAKDILVVCGYSPQTKIKDTQLAKRGLINRRDGGWVVKQLPRRAVGVCLGKQDGASKTLVINQPS